MKQEYFLRYTREKCQRYFELFISRHLTSSKLISFLLLAQNELAANECDPKTDKQLWFRFFEGDTLVTTINGLDRVLVDMNDTRANIETLNESIALCVANNSLKVYFS